VVVHVEVDRDAAPQQVLHRRGIRTGKGICLLFYAAF
jgi:hypothetical protein